MVSPASTLGSINHGGIKATNECQVLKPVNHIKGICPTCCTIPLTLEYMLLLYFLKPIYKMLKGR